MTRSDNLKLKCKFLLNGVVLQWSNSIYSFAYLNYKIGLKFDTIRCEMNKFDFSVAKKRYQVEWIFLAGGGEGGNVAA